MSLTDINTKLGITSSKYVRGMKWGIVALYFIGSLFIDYPMSVNFIFLALVLEYIRK